MSGRPQHQEAPHGCWEAEAKSKQAEHEERLCGLRAVEGTGWVCLEKAEMGPEAAPQSGRAGMWKTAYPAPSPGGPGGLHLG